MTKHIDLDALQALAPCPFCGGHAQTDFIDGGTCRIECHDCDCHTAHLDTPEQAIAAWNRRADTGKSAEALEAERYRFLRERATFGKSAQWRDVDQPICHLAFSGYGHDIDAAIDAAISAGPAAPEGGKP